MKITKILIFIYFSCSWFAHANTYVWEDYDDFSDNSLDFSKWISSNEYFSGNEPIEASGRVELAALNLPNSNYNTFLILKDLDNITGVEADIWLPINASKETGVLIGIADQGVPFGFIDLWADSGQANLYVKLENSSTSESTDFTKIAQLGESYRVGIIMDEGKTALFLNGEEVAEAVPYNLKI